jgi:MFS family permease
MLLHNFGWRWLFVIIGGVSMLWLIPWGIIAGGVKTGKDAHLSEGYAETPSFSDILEHREAWGTFLGLFCGNYGWYFMLTWLPQYFIKARKYSDVMMAQLGSLPFWSVAAGAVVGGYASDFWIQHGGSPTRVRKTFTVGGLGLFAVIFLPGAIVSDERLGLWLMITASFCFGLFSSNHWAITQTLAGTVAAGKWTGVQNLCGNIAGIVVPVVTGFVLDKTGQFYWAVVTVCGLVMVGALSYLLIIRRIEPVSWTAPRR